MKGKYFQALFLIGVLPLLALLGVSFWLALNQPAPKPNLPVSSVSPISIPMLQSKIQTLALALTSAVERTDGDILQISVNGSDTDLDNFVKSHPGVRGLVLLSNQGKVLKTFPAGAQLVDANYGTSEEFQKVVTKLQELNGKTYLFYTQRLAYPAFVFAAAGQDKTIAEAILDISYPFNDVDLKGGEIFLLDAMTGRYFYHSNPAKLQSPFNSDQEPWLAKVQADITAKKSGYEAGPERTAIYSYLGLAPFGIVQLIPNAVLQPATPAAPPKNPIDDLQGFIHSPITLVALLALAWIFIIGSLYWGMILSPLSKATEKILAVTQKGGILTPVDAQAFGKDEVGQMVQAVAGLLQKLDDEKQHSTKEADEAVRRARTQLEEKSRQADEQVKAAQAQVQSAKAELNEKNQQLNDKLKEMDALKAMSEGLRNQNEQTKTENARIKTQSSETEQSLNQKLAESQQKLSEMESKMLTAVAASSAIQVSQVRAAAIRTMAEELRTTLGIIKGYVSSALGTSQGGINEKQQEFLGMVINRSARLEKFINDLLDIYQVEIEQKDVKTEEVNLASEIEGLAFNFQAQAEVKNIKMKVEAKPNLPKIPIVRRRFNQLWNILYLQVIKDAPRGSTIPITVEPIGTNIKVTLQDPGLTIAPESLPKLFDEFYDPKHPASPQLAGTGLKFALVKTILAAHGGGAVAEKAEPGTRLILTFPTQVKKPGSTPTPAPAPAQPAIGLPKAAVVTPPGGVGFVKPSSFTPGGIGQLKPPAPGAGLPKPPGSSAGILDSLISNVPSVNSQGLRPSPPPLSAPGSISPGTVKPTTPVTSSPSSAPPPLKPSGSADQPAVPNMPPSGSVPKPPAAGLFDALLENKAPAPPAAPAAPNTAQGIPAPKPFAPPMPGSPKGPFTPGGLEALLNKPAPPGINPPTVTPMPGSIGSVKPPVPSDASLPPKAPPMPGPASPKAPEIPPMTSRLVPTSLKPTAPPSGVFDLDNADSVKLEEGPSAKAPGGASGSQTSPGTSMPPGGLNANKPIVKDLNKEGEGELIE